MELTTISEISKRMSISTRTLRYYEQIGLIESVKKDDYAYRVYDEATIIRLQQILVLRKLRIPLKQIKLILKSESTAAIIGAFQHNLSEVDDEITALSTIRDIINTFIMRLKESTHQDIKLNLLDDTALLETVDALTVQKIPLKEGKAAADLENITDEKIEVYYVTLAPARAVAYSVVDVEPEDKACEPVLKWIEENNLKGTMRLYGFNTHEKADPPAYGFGYYATIPEEIEIPEPLREKRLPGGTYAVISKYEGDPSHGWQKIRELMKDPEWEWEYDGSGGCVGLEEHIERPGGGHIIPVMLPVKKKDKK